MMRIKADQQCGYLVAEVGDCIVLSHVGSVHSTVLHRMQNTVTTRPGELGVLVEVRE